MKLERVFDVKAPMGVLSHAVRGNLLVAGCMDGVYRVDLQSKAMEKLDEHGSYVSSVVHLSDSPVVISGGYDGALQWYDVEAKKRIRRAEIHDFWSWDMAVSPDEKWIASVTGQYLADGYRYEPMAEREPSVKVVSVETGEVAHELEHVPSVQAVAFSHDGKWLAAGNLMGEVRVWSVESGALRTSIKTDAFTSWGIIKSHCYLGGVFSLRFAPDDQSILLAGMGPMRDPMAGNGRQLWQQWSLPTSEADAAAPKLLKETRKDQAGEGLMEALAVSEHRSEFLMGGRLRGGQWNAALFSWESGDRVAELKTGYRVTEAHFIEDGAKISVSGTQGQPKPKPDGASGKFGRIEVYQLT